MLRSIGKQSGESGESVVTVPKHLPDQNHVLCHDSFDLLCSRILKLVLLEKCCRV